MFTGIINSIGIIESAKQQGDLRVKIACDWPLESLRIGDSVACNGVCLTIVERGTWNVETTHHVPRATFHDTYFTASLSPETISRTAPRWEKGQRVNLERALKMGDALGGHLVTGHVDGIAIIKDIAASGDSHSICVEAPEALVRFIAEKGSVTLDGVSLTVNKVEKRRFWVNIIPHTWQNTTLGEHKPGDGLNLEIDLIARYVARLTESRNL